MQNSVQFEHYPRHNLCQWEIKVTVFYDIDLSYIAPPEVFKDPNSARLMEAAGISLNARGNYLAKFRDPRAAKALAGASETVRAYFESCGFAFIASGLNLPNGYFDRQFDNHLRDVAQRMSENFPKYELRGQNWNGFDIQACLNAIGTAQPMDVQRKKAPKANQQIRLKKSFFQRLFS